VDAGQAFPGRTSVGFVWGVGVGGGGQGLLGGDLGRRLRLLPLIQPGRAERQIADDFLETPRPFGFFFVFWLVAVPGGGTCTEKCQHRPRLVLMLFSFGILQACRFSNPARIPPPPPALSLSPLSSPSFTAFEPLRVKAGKTLLDGSGGFGNVFFLFSFFFFLIRLMFDAFWPSRFSFFLWALDPKPAIRPRR